MDELSGERVDVIEWSDDPTHAYCPLTSTSKINNVVIVIPEEGLIPILVDE